MGEVERLAVWWSGEKVVEGAGGPKTEILGPKKGTHFWGFTMFWSRPEKVVQRKKDPLPK